MRQHALDRQNRLTLQQRFFLGIGVPLVGSLLLWVLWPFYMHWLMVIQGRLGWDLGGFSLRFYLFIGALMLLCGVGAALMGSWWALLVVPLALLVGGLLGLNFFDEFGSRSSANQLIVYLKPVMVEAFIGAILGLAVVKSQPFVQRAWVNRPRYPQGLVAQDILPPDGRPVAAAGARISPPATSVTLPEPAPPQTPMAAQAAEPEPDEIAAIVAQMQQAYAGAQSQEQAAGPPAPANAAEAVLRLSPEEQRLLKQYRQQRQQQQQEPPPNPEQEHERSR